MEELFPRLERFKRPIKFRRVLLALGIALSAVGIIVFSYPQQSYAVISFIVGIAIIASGIMQIVAGSYVLAGGKGWQTAVGIIEIALGLILMFSVRASAVIIPLFMGFWLLFRGLTMIGLASDMRSAGITGTGWTVFWAVLLMLCAFLVLVFPTLGIGAIIVWLGLSFLCLGVSMIFISLYPVNRRKGPDARHDEEQP